MAQRGTGAATGELGACETCGMPTTGEQCAFCRQQERILESLGRDRAELPLAEPSSGARREADTARLAREVGA